MVMLPDIDAGSWLDHQKQELDRQLNEKLQGFGLGQAIGEKISGLQSFAGGAPPAPESAPAGPVAPEPSGLLSGGPPTASAAAASTPIAPEPSGGSARPAPEPSVFERAGQGLGQLGQGARQLLAPEPTPSRPPSASSGGRGGFSGPVNPNPSSAEVRDYIVQAARARGIDPQTALTVAQGEGGFEAARRGTFGTGSSWWPFQLHYGGKGYEHLGTTAGMGNEFTARTGYQPGDPNAWQAATDFALDKAAQGGWGPWYGAKAAGITGFEGIGQAAKRGAGAVGDFVSGAQEPGWLGLAKEQLNKPYIWGSQSGAGGRGMGDVDPKTGLPVGFDCSGYVSWVLKNGLGVDLPAFTGSAYDKTASISANQARPGDIVFYNMDQGDPRVQHMALYIGNGQIIQAGGGQGKGVNIASVNSVGAPEFRRAAGTDAADARTFVGGALQGAGGMVGEGFSRLGSAAQGIASSAQQRVSEGLDALEQGRRQLSSEIDRRLADLGQAVSGGGETWDYNLQPNTVQRAMSEPGGAPQSPGTGNPLIDLPGTLASATGSAVSTLGAGLNEISPLTQVGRLTAGVTQTGLNDPEIQSLQQQIRELDRHMTPDTWQQIELEKRALNERIVQRGNELVRNQGLGATYEASRTSPLREQEELFANLAGAVPSIAVAPQGLASGGGRFAASVALDPAGAPFAAAGELVGPALRAASRYLPNVSAPSGTAANIVEDAARYAPGTPEFAVDEVMRTSRDAVGGDGLAHVALADIPNVPFAPGLAIESGGKVIKTNAGGLPSMDDLRLLVDLNQGSRDWYPDAASIGQLLAPENLDEFFTINAITSMGTRLPMQYAEAINTMRVVREAADEAAAAGQDVEAAVVAAIRDPQRLSFQGPTGPNKRKAIEAAYTTGEAAVSSGAKTSVFSGSHASAGERLFEPRGVSDIWNWRAFNVSDDEVRRWNPKKNKEEIDRVWESRAANNDSAYRVVEAAMNELAREKGVPIHAVQAPIWIGIKQMAELAPDVFKRYQAGDFQGAIREAAARGLFQAESSGDAMAVLRHPSVVKALDQAGGMLRTAPPLQGQGMLRSYGGKGAQPRPYTREWVAAERAAAEGAAPMAELGDARLLEAAGMDPETRTLPWLSVPHRVELVGDKAYVHLPGGNSQTARYVGSLLADARGAASYAVHTPNYRAPDIGGFSIVGSPEEMRGLADSLAAAGIEHVAGPTGRSVQIPLQSGFGDDIGSAIVQAAESSGITRDRLNPYAGATSHVLSAEYARDIESLGPAFGATTPERLDLQQRAIAELRRAAAGGTGRGDYGAAAVPAPRLPGASAGILERGAAPLRTSVGRGALQGAIAGGYEASQEEGATPQSVALGALGGSVLGGARGAMGPRGASRLGRAASAIEGEPFTTHGPAPNAERKVPLFTPDGALNPSPAKSASELIIPGQEPAPALSQIVDPRGNLLSEVAPGRAGREAVAGIVRTDAGAEYVQLPTSQDVLKRMPNLKYMAEGDADIQASLIRAAEENAGLINRYQRGTQKWSELVDELAPNLGMTTEEFLKSKPGQAFNEVEMVALRAAMVAKEEASIETAKKIQRMGGAKELTPEEQLAAVRELHDAVRLQATAVGGASTAARTLNQQKIRMDAILGQKITTANEKVAAERALTAAQQKAERAARAKEAADAAKAERAQARAAAKEVARQEGRKAAAMDTMRQIERAYTDLDTYRAMSLGEKEEVHAARLQARADAAAARADALESGGEDGLNELLAALRKELDAEQKHFGKSRDTWSDMAFWASERGKLLQKQINNNAEVGQWLADEADQATKGLRAAESRQSKAWNRELQQAGYERERARKALKVLGPERITVKMLDEYSKLVTSNNPLALGKFMRGLKQTSWWDRLDILRYGALLSSTATIGTQTISNAVQLGLMMGTHAASVPFDIAAQAIRGGERTRYMGEVGEQWRGIREGWSASFDQAMEVLKSGASTSPSADLEHIQAGFGSGSGKVDFAFEAPMRFMSAGDTLIRGMATAAQTRGLAMRTALNEGLSGSAARARAQDIMQNLDDYPELLTEAQRIAKGVVLQEERRVAQILPRQGGWGRVVSLALPFIKTPLNVVAQGVGMTPLGFLGALESGVRGNRAQSVDRAGKALVGSAVLGVAAVMGANEFLTAGYPEDEAERSTLPPGWRPWSVRIAGPEGTTYIPFAFLGPVAVPMAIGAVVGDMWRRGEEISDEVGAIAISSIGRFMVDQSSLMGLNNAINAALEPKRYGERFVEGLASQAVPYSSLQRQIMQALDVAPRDPEGFVEAVAAAFAPTAGMVKPRLDPLGREVEAQASGVLPIRFSTGRDEPTLRALRQAEVNIPEGARSYSGIPLNEQEQRQHQIRSGQEIERLVGDFVNSERYQQMTPTQRQAALQAYIQAARARAGAEFVRGLPQGEAANRVRQEQLRQAPGGR